MEISDLKQMIAYTKQWKAYLESVKMCEKDEIGKMKLVEQMKDAINIWEKELQTRAKN